MFKVFLKFKIMQNFQHMQKAIYSFYQITKQMIYG